MKICLILLPKFIIIQLKKKIQENIRNQISSFLEQLAGFPKIDGDLRFDYTLPLEIVNLHKNSLPNFIESFFQDLGDLEDGEISQKYEFKDTFLKDFSIDLILKTVKNYNPKKFLDHLISN